MSDSEGPSDAKRSRSTAPPSNHPHFSFEIVGGESCALKNLKYRSTTTRYKFTHQLADMRSLEQFAQVQDEITEVFRAIVEPQIASAEPNDIINVSIEHQHLLKKWNGPIIEDDSGNPPVPIFTHNVRKNMLRYEAFAEKIASLAQSNTSFLLDGVMDVCVGIIDMPVGGTNRPKRTESARSIDEHFDSKICVIKIDNYNNACGYYALLLGNYLFENKPMLESKQGKLDWKNMRRMKGEFFNKHLRQFVRISEVDITQPLTIQMLPSIQQHFVNLFQIYVIERPKTLPPKHTLLFKGESNAVNILYLEYIPGETIGHFNLIKSLVPYYEGKDFCVDCGTIIQNLHRHYCASVCKLCKTKHTDETNQLLKTLCAICSRDFPSKQCYDNHLVNKVCGRSKQCPDCEIFYHIDKRHAHDCRKYHCNTCEENYTETPHYCCVKKTDIEKLQKEDAKKKIMIFFDIEAYTGYFGGERKLHQPNLLVSHVTCDNCWDSASQSRVESCAFCGKEQYVYEKEECVKLFCDDLYGFISRNADKQKMKVYVFAHNLKSYDGRFILKDLYTRNISNTKLIMSGTKIMKLQVANIRFVDSLNLLPLPLAKLPASFGFAERVKKGFMYHGWNSPEMWSYDGIIPPIDSEDLKYMTKPQAEALVKWHGEEEQRMRQDGSTFNFRNELIKYCIDDVNVLKLAVYGFRGLFKETTGIDPITRKFTLASIALECFRANNLKNQTIGITPIEGYSKARKFSRKERLWLDMLEHTSSVRIQRQHRLFKYWPDGYVQEKDGTETVYEFFGCWYHGCAKCHKFDTDLFINGKDNAPSKAGELYQKTKDRVSYFERFGCKVIQIWECDFNIIMAACNAEGEYCRSRDRDIRDEEATYGARQTASVEDSFRGGRTEAIVNRYFAKDDEEIHYVDVTSLYPFVLSTKPYPIGHPQVITQDFHKFDEEFFGFIRCKIVAPRNIHLPVLPTRCRGKLIFALCRICAEENSSKPCWHKDDDRAFDGTWTTIEINEAVEQGYRVMKIFEVLHYPQKDDTLFKEYIKGWLKIKTEASGWPKDCITPTDKINFIREFQKREGIELYPEKMIKNPGLRLIAKLMLNSLWGKLAQRPNQPQTVYVTEYADLLKIVIDPKIKVTSLVEVHRDAAGETGHMLVTYEMVDAAFCSQQNTSLAVASFVTAYGRIELSRLMTRIETDRETFGFRVFYFDTDSVIFLHKKGLDKPIERSNFLGGLTDEIADMSGSKDARCKRFLCLGAKNYALEILHPDGRKQYVCKSKGISLNQETVRLLSFEAQSSLVDNFLRNKLNTNIALQSLKVPQFNIIGDKHEQIPISIHTMKIVRATCDKRAYYTDYETHNTIRNEHNVRDYEGSIPFGINFRLAEIEKDASEAEIMFKYGNVYWDSNFKH